MKVTVLVVSFKRVGISSTVGHQWLKRWNESENEYFYLYFRNDCLYIQYDHVNSSENITTDIKKLLCLNKNKDLMAKTQNEINITRITYLHLFLM
ncbi:hypothetical protein Metev_2343 (plasmid) [Methanohalobium evestigatum Z-7303]|uniref:Uncharacterized protein n=1 Tax=Methanohalobium evestigatum (strain ATCC BAA-1072 / DSM 3721 / NBRC 107634 / OCM 161 / Z-7303) TaxID=644295 RepID=D7EC32_METEZ|nr:hypothetical protein Metev_2343 [Methanohalobium evestigatum Z-7303]